MEQEQLFGNFGEIDRLRERVVYLEGLLAKARNGHGNEFVRNDDPAAAHAGAAHVEATEGPTMILRPASHRHQALTVYAAAYPKELTATEAGQRATPTHDRVTGATRRTYDLSGRGLVLRGDRGFTITEKGREVLGLLDRGQVVKLKDGA